MAAVAHSPAFAKKVGVPQTVGKDFNKADKGRKFKEGGDTMATKMNPGFMAMMAKKKGAAPDALAKHAAKPADKAHAGLTAKKMANGGATDPRVAAMMAARQGGARPPMAGARPPMPGARPPMPGARPPMAAPGMKKGGKASCYANGGYVRAADGVATKGKTKGKFI